jgi:hypothetical protein
MKKQILALSLATALLCTFVACSEENELTPDNGGELSLSRTESRTLPTVPVSVSAPVSVSPVSRTIDPRNVNFESTLGSQWLLYSPVCFVLGERMWNETHGEITNITYGEVFLRWLKINHGFEICENVKAYENMRTSPRYTEIHDIIRDIMFESEFTAIDNHTREVVINLELLRHFSITHDEFARANNSLIEQKEILNELSVNSGLLRPDEISCPYNWHLTPDEIDLLFSNDITAIKRAALNPWSIMVEDRVYSAQWLLDHSPQEWAAEGIPESAISRAFEIFRVVLNDEQAAVFEGELTVFRESVRE